MWFRNYESVWTYLSFPFHRNKKEKEIREFKVDFEKSVLLTFLSYHKIYITAKRPGLKTRMDFN